MDKDVLRLRRFNRFYTGFIGLLNRRILGGPLSLGQARLLYEIGRQPGCRAAELAEGLGMDKGYLSRMLSGLAGKGLVEREPVASDRRSASLGLTEPGRVLLAELEARSNDQARSMLASLSRSGRERALAAMDGLESALAHEPPPPEVPAIRTGPVPGDCGWVVESHGRVYHREYGFDASFEGYVMDGLAAFLRTDPDDRLLLLAEAGGLRVGSVAVMPRPGGPWQMRWFLVEPEYRAHGLGRALFTRAMEFARERGAPGTYLWTLGHLDAARRLYQSLGFTLTETKAGSMGGVPLNEERWDLSFSS